MVVTIPLVLHLHVSNYQCHFHLWQLNGKSIKDWYSIASTASGPIKRTGSGPIKTTVRKLRQESYIRHFTRKKDLKKTVPVCVLLSI